MKKVSIIIPIYNASKHLKKCLDSVLNQSYKDIEIICVNDGSNDNSLNILKEYKDKRIKIINKKNGGVSSSRNEGIKKATGYYIMFVDADDTLEKDAVKICLDNIDDCDALRFCTNEIKQDGSIGIYPGLYNKYENKILSSNEVMNDLVKGSISGHCFLWLLKKEFIDKDMLLFNENFAYCEDLLFVLSYVKNVKKIKIINNRLYNYYYNETSATKSFEKKINNLKSLSKLKSEVFKIIDKKYYDLYKQNLLSLIVFYYSSFAKEFNLKKFKEIIKDLNINLKEIFNTIDLNKVGKGSKIFIKLNLKNKLNLLYLYFYVFNKLKW